MNEAETRAEHIDPAIAAAGWGVVDGSRVRREYGIAPGRLEGSGKRGKSLTADYVLEYHNTKLAIIEAKAWDEPLTQGVAQAKHYAEKLEIRFTYATNGQRRRGRTRPGQADAATSPEIPQLHSRRRGRPRQARGDRQSVCRVPEVSLRDRGVSDRSHRGICGWLFTAGTTQSRCYCSRR